MKVSEKLTPTEQIMADTLLAQMGLTEADRYQEEIHAELSNDFEQNHVMYENTDIVDKPQHVIAKEFATENARVGITLHTDKLIPLKRYVIVKMENDREEVTKSGIVIQDRRTVKQDPQIGEVIALNPECLYEFKLHDRVLVNNMRVRHRFNYDGALYFIVHKIQILGVF